MAFDSTSEVTFAPFPVSMPKPSYRLASRYVKLVLNTWQTVAKVIKTLVSVYCIYNHLFFP